MLPATAHRTVLEKNVDTFLDIKLDGSIITRLDDSAILGGPLSVAIMSKLPLAYFCDGQKIPDDFHLARAHKLANQAINVSDQFPGSQTTETDSSQKAGKAANVSI